MSERKDVVSGINFMNVIAHYKKRKFHSSVFFRVDPKMFSTRFRFSSVITDS